MISINFEKVDRSNNFVEETNPAKLTLIGNPKGGHLYLF